MKAVVIFFLSKMFIHIILHYLIISKTLLLIRISGMYSREKEGKKSVYPTLAFKYFKSESSDNRTNAYTSR